MLMSSPLALASWDGAELPSQSTTASGGESVAARLLDWRFLESRIRDRGVFALVEDLCEGISMLSLDRPERRLLILIQEAVRRSTMFLAEQPNRLFQCVWNLGWWYDSALATRFYQTDKNTGRAGVPVLRLSTWLEQWRAARAVEQPSATWVRALTPPDMPLGRGIVATLAGHDDSVCCVAFSRDGRWFASGSSDRTVLLWDTRTGEPHLWPGQATGTIEVVTFAPDGQRVAAVSGAGEVVVWDVTSNEIVAQWSFRADGVSSMVWTLDGQALWIATNHGFVCWHAQRGTELRRIPLRHGCASRCELLIGNSADIAVSAGNDGVWLIDLKTGDSWPLGDRAAREHSIESAALSPDGQLLATHGFGDCVRMWETRTGRQLWNTDFAVSANRERHFFGSSLTFTANGDTLIVGAYDGTLHRLNPRTGTAQLGQQRIGDYPTLLVVSPDGRWLGAVENSRLLRLLDGQPPAIAAPEVRPELRSSSDFSTSPDGRWLVIGNFEGHLTVWNLAEGRLQEEWFAIEDQAWINTPPADAPFDTYPSPNTWIWTWTKTPPLDAGSDCVEIPDLLFISAVAISSEGQLIAIGDRQCHVKLLDRRTGQLRLLRGHTIHIRRLGFSADGQYLASQSYDGTLRVWHIPTEREVCRAPVACGLEPQRHTTMTTNGRFLLARNEQQRFAFDTESAQFVDEADLDELFADQPTEWQQNRISLDRLRRAQSEHLHEARAAFDAATLPEFFQQLPNASPVTWFGEFHTPDLLLRLET